ncbi:14140_t:CDS:2, partial [Racocetra persica]
QGLESEYLESSYKEPSSPQLSSQEQSSQVPAPAPQAFLPKTPPPQALLLSQVSLSPQPPGYQVTGTFVLFTHLVPDPKGSGVVIWVPHENTPLSLSYNPNPITTILDAGSSKITYPPHGVVMHPSYDGKFSVARFTAPTNGNYILSVMFTHVDDHANFIHTGGYIVYNNSLTLWETDLFGIGDFKSYKSTITVRENETIDFIIGNGLDN